MYGEKDYSKAMFREVKSTWVADFLGRLDSIKKDATFKLPQEKLFDLVARTFGIDPLNKSTEITKQISFWIDGLETSASEIESNDNLSNVTATIQNKIESINNENPDLFEDLNEIDVYFHDSLLQDPTFINDSEKELSELLEQKAIEYNELQGDEES